MNDPQLRQIGLRFSRCGQGMRAADISAGPLRRTGVAGVAGVAGAILGFDTGCLRLERTAG